MYKNQVQEPKLLTLKTGNETSKEKLGFGGDDSNKTTSLRESKFVY